MSVTKGELIFHGLNNIETQIDYIINDLNLKELYFEIKLIIFEAVSNAFIHGNNGDNSKPILIQWNLKDKLLGIRVTDFGSGFKDLPIYEEINECNVLEEGGRGLFLIRCYTDKMYFEGNTIIMKKYV